MTLPLLHKLSAVVLSAAALATIAAPADAGDASLRVKRLVLAHGIDGHEPQEPTTTFQTKDDRVYAFVEVVNPARADKTILVVFEPPDGPALAPIRLDVKAGAPRFRTWAFTRRAHEVGDWGVIVRDTTGRVLAKESFKVAR